MNKTRKIVIVAIVVIIIIVAGAAYYGNIVDDDPTHIVVTNGQDEPDSGFNPLTGWGCGHQNFNTLIFSTLLTTDDNGNFTNDLATGYNISDDGLTWTVGIRDDVLFSDNTTLTAKDVAFTFNTAKTSNSELDMSNLVEAVAVDNYTVKFHLEEPQSTFIYNLRYVGIVKADGYDNETFGENPIGSGPYKLVQWDKGEQAIFEVNENYYGETPYFTQVTLLFPDESSLIQLAKSGEADVVQATLTDVNQTVEGYTLVDMPAGRAQGISLPNSNNTGQTTEDGNPIGNNVTADESIRKALNIGIDRQTIVDSVYQGHGAVEYTGVDSREYGNAEEGSVSDGDVATANQTLEEAGWVDSDGDGIREKDGVRASFKLYYPSDDSARQALATVISEQAKTMGIEIELVGTDWDTIYDNMFSSAVVMQQTSADPYRSVYQQYHSKEYTDDDYMNPNGYNNSAIDTILEAGMTATDQETANEYWKEAAYNDGEGFSPNGDAPWLWVATYDYSYFVADDIDMGTAAENNGQDVLMNIVEWTRTNTTS
ncbi:MAG: ABC transporter substrate-binding protein [Methanosphaera sp.]|nr:ABC transporter substrate-binding protein [Methanosphaera sp.]